MKHTFLGFQRPGSMTGVRNKLLLVPTVSCSSTVSERISSTVEDSAYVSNMLGCAQSGRDLQQTADTIVGYGLNGNVAGVLAVSLGCETLLDTEVIKRLVDTGKPVEWIGIQKSGGEKKTFENGKKISRRMRKESSLLTRNELEIGNLIVGVMCASPDDTCLTLSNQVIGELCRELVRLGATCILSGPPSFHEHQSLLSRLSKDGTCIPERLLIEEYSQVGTQILPVYEQAAVNRVSEHRITEEETVLESFLVNNLGLNGFLDYAQRVAGPGMYLMRGSSSEVESLTGLVASGAQIIICTTGRGSSIGNPISPVIKITSNEAIYSRMKSNFDFYVDRKDDDTVGNMMFELLKIASGKSVQAEILGHEEFAIARAGPSY